MESDAPVIFRFHGELKPLINPGAYAPSPGRDGVREVRRSGFVIYPVTRSASLKDAIEALGIPHTEVGCITVDGLAMGFDEPLLPGLTVGVYPVNAPTDVTLAHPLRPKPLADVSFAVDACVGKLATLLRLLGLDTAYEQDWDDDELVELASEQGRIVLTRDKALLKRSAVSHGRLVRAQEPTEQLLEVLTHFGLKGPFTPFVRCLRCNDLLEPVSKAEILHLLEPLTRKHYHEFHRCRSCGRIYWPGSHHEAMREWLNSVGLD
ncbi:Mut7-C RNAse domain-containing protein [Desulfovibrio ferrophilus]|uniref:Twitching motility protein PilT n=1 Tax=Desulfovibrio ferrophilus TaxID=241368 RepID=A0A2Z6B235_9BACT|nr:Mut7-C RNAse domain-containing protein [Desulfovibrio ferrophilus]BBD09466.1 uncharacterized protein DFE_2740 [Desulfovibrio ferrophilus]